MFSVAVRVFSVLITYYQGFEPAESLEKGFVGNNESYSCQVEESHIIFFILSFLLCPLKSRFLFCFFFCFFSKDLRNIPMYEYKDEVIDEGFCGWTFSEIESKGGRASQIS